MKNCAKKSATFSRLGDREQFSEEGAATGRFLREPGFLIIEVSTLISKFSAKPEQTHPTKRL